MSKSKTYVYHTSITYLHISTHLVVIHQNAGQMHNILDRLSFFPHMPFSLLFKCSRVSCYEGGTCFPYETPHRPKPAIFVENRNGRIQPSKHTNLKLIRVFIIIIILLFCTVLIWLGKIFTFLIYFDFCPKKEIAPAFQRKKKKNSNVARNLEWPGGEACVSTYIYFWANEKGRGGEREQNSFIDFCVATTQTAVLCYSAVEVSQETLVLL